MVTVTKYRGFQEEEVVCYFTKWSFQTGACFSKLSGLKRSLVNDICIPAIVFDTPGRKESK